ncbi:MAG: hypothetical protein HYX53_03415 [Chloroflexi bacterium]|nr:hypothetical protein [Chloroflexota bacterium]
MALKMTDRTDIPDPGYRKGPRDSLCTQAVGKAQTNGTGIVAVESDDMDELQRFYKSMIQWRTRHKEYNVGLRKGRDAVYVWIIKDGENKLPKKAPVAVFGAKPNAFMSRSSAPTPSRRSTIP